jgi:hypothetical protein
MVLKIKKKESDAYTAELIKIYILDIKSKIRNLKIKKMYVPFENLRKNPKFGFINRIENFRTEFSEIETDLQAFLENWAAHEQV